MRVHQIFRWDQTGGESDRPFQPEGVAYPIQHSWTSKRLYARGAPGEYEVIATQFTQAVSG